MSAIWWCIKDTQGHLLAWTARGNREQAKKAYCQHGMSRLWGTAKQSGFRCVRLQVEEAKDDNRPA